MRTNMIDISLTLSNMIGKPMFKPWLVIISTIACMHAVAAQADVVKAEEVQSDAVLNYLTDAAGRYTGPTLEDNVARMDADKNGFADVFEVRSYLELQHGKGYEKELLDKWEASASGKSCSTPFAKELYSDKTN